MDLQKICPVCKTPNSAHELLCKRCMTDISTVECARPNVPSPAPVAPGPVVSHAEPPAADPPPILETATPESAKTVIQRRSRLRLKLEHFEFEIEDGDVIGRNNVGKEVLTQFPGISRRHARFSFENGRWVVEDLKSTNGTFVNGTALREGERCPLKTGDKIGISRKVTFEVTAP